MCSVRKIINTITLTTDGEQSSFYLVNKQFSLLVCVPTLPGPTYPAQTKPKPVPIVPPIGSSVGYCPCR